MCFERTRVVHRSCVFDHVTIRVRDREASERFYAHVLPAVYNGAPREGNLDHQQPDNGPAMVSTSASGTLDAVNCFKASAPRVQTDARDANA